jgi:hypothetical protein
MTEDLSGDESVTFDELRFYHRTTLSLFLQAQRSLVMEISKRKEEECRLPESLRRILRGSEGVTKNGAVS